MTQQEAKTIMENWEETLKLEQFEEVIENYQAVKAYYKQLQDWKNYSIASIRLAHCYFYKKGDTLDKVKSELADVEQLPLNKTGKYSDELRQVYRLLARYYIQKTSFIEAKKYVHKALKIARYLYGERSRNVASLYLYLGEICDYENDQYEALKWCDQSKSIFLELYGDETMELAIVYRSMGLVYMELSDLGKAGSYLNKSLSIIWKNHKEDHSFIPDIYADLGMVASLEGDDTKACNYYYKAIHIYKKIKTKGLWLAHCYHNLGISIANQKNFREAELLYKKSLDLQLKTIGADSLSVCDNYLGLAAIANRQNEFEKAIFFASKGLAVIKKLVGENHSMTALLYQSLGRTHGKQSQYDECIDFLQKALKALIPDFNPLYDYDNPSIVHNDNAVRTVKVLATKANFLWERYLMTKIDQDLQGAYETLQLVLKWLDEIQRGYQTERSKMVLLNDEGILRAYQVALSCNLELYGQSQDRKFLENAFWVAEKSRANILLEQLRNVAATKLANIPSEILQKEKQLKIKLTYLNNRIQQLHNQLPKNNNLISQLQGQYFDHEQVYQALIRQFENDYPQYYQLKHQVESVTLEHLQQKISSNTALIEYFIGEKQLFIFVITSNENELLQFPKPDGFEELVEAFKASIDEIDKTEYTELAFELYQLLIAPIEEYLLTNIQYRITNLKIIPSGLLSTIPFEALLTHEVQTNNQYADLPYLLLQYDISYHYSATLWSQSQVERVSTHSIKNEQNKSSFIGFAPVYKSEQEESLEENITRGIYNEDTTRSIQIGEETFSELVYSEEEVNTIQSYFQNQNIPTQTFLHAQANTSNFIQNVGKHKYVLISAHGFYNEKQPDLTGIILSPNNKVSASFSNVAEPMEIAENSPSFEKHGDVRSGRVSPNPTNVGEPPSIFHLSDAYNLELNADLVVLSCCETGVGKLAKGEGVMALNRGFFYAGAKNVIYTLFKVYDQASCQLTQHLFRHILEGEAYSLALKEAKHRLILEGKAPIHWAGYLLIGE